MPDHVVMFLQIMRYQRMGFPTVASQDGSDNTDNSNNSELGSLTSTPVKKHSHPRKAGSSSSGSTPVSRRRRSNSKSNISKEDTLSKSPSLDPDALVSALDQGKKDSVGEEEEDE